jgi:hypothetical protein
MDTGFINDIIALERKYANSKESLPSTYINRISRLIKELNDDEKRSCQLYIQKFNDLIGSKSYSVDELMNNINELLELCKLGKHIIKVYTCSQVTEKLDDIIIQSKHVERNFEGDFSNIRNKIDWTLTKCFREIMPSLIAQKAVVGDVLASNDEIIL